MVFLKWSSNTVTRHCSVFDKLLLLSASQTVAYNFCMLEVDIKSKSR